MTAHTAPPDRKPLFGHLIAALMALLLSMTALFSTPTQAAAFEPLKALLRPAPLAEQLRLANQAINALDYEPTPGTWLTPGELVQRGAGDCKDLAFAKYWLLKGVAREHRAIRLAYGQVHLEGRWQAHLVVLVWSDDGPPWVLDNVVQTLQRLNDRPDLSVQFSFDESGYFDGISHQPRRGLRIKGWAELQARLAAAAPV